MPEVCNLPERFTQESQGPLSHFEETLHTMRPKLIQYIHRRIGDYHAAEDIAQESLFRAFRARETLADPDRLRNWIYSIAFHVTVDWLRHRGACKRYAMIHDLRRAESPNTSGADETVMVREAREGARKKVIDIWKRVQDLPPIYREVFELRYRNWRPLSEIAQKLGIPEGNVKIRLFRARRMLSC